MSTHFSLVRRTAASAAGLLLATLLVVAPWTEPPVARASASGLNDTFATLNGSSYFSVPDNPVFDMNGDLTVSAWLRPDAACVAASTECVFVSKDENMIFAIRNGRFDWALMNSAGTSWDWRGTGVVPVVDQWQHVSFVVKRSTNTLRLYINGTLTYTTTNATSVPSTSAGSSHPFMIGARSRVSIRSFFTGSIDEVRVYNTARDSEAQAQADMNTWGPANNSGLVAYYDFNEGSGSTLTNRVTGASSATHLTATGSPTWTDAKSMSLDGATATITFSRTYLTQAGGWTPPTGLTQARALIVGGGGGGGSSYDQPGAGGGGAGGVINRWTSGSVSISAGAMPVVVGAAGKGDWGSATTGIGRELWREAGKSGTNSQFASLTAVGGGGGGPRLGSGLSGGSGGGAGGRAASSVGGAATSGQGNTGGRPSEDWSHGGGGGGAGGAGGGSSSTVRGAGGAGVAYTINGSSRTFAVGGQGGARNGSTLQAASASEGSGSGGGGGDGVPSGTVGGSGGDGGSGVVIVSFTVPCEIQSWNGVGGSTLIQYQVPAGFDACATDFTTPANVTALDAVVVGGGGGGGGGNTSNNTAGGGGGGGQVLNLRAQAVNPSTTYSIVVGRGGAGGAGNAGAATGGGSGIASSAFGSTANGGNGGGGAPSSGDINSAAGDGGASGSGNAGGPNEWEGAGGGGGAGSPGVKGEDIGGPGGHGGPGGNGVMPGWVIGWCGGMFGGGGGGGTTATAVQSRIPTGGPGGGGTGANYTVAATAGTNHCGGGGGGGGGQTASRNGANGGSGVVYVRYNHPHSAESFFDGADLEVALGTAANLGLGSNVVTDYTLGETVRVRLGTTNGTLSIGNASGTTVTGDGTGAVTVVGAQADVNTALSSATLTASTLSSTQITIDVDMNPTNQTIGGATFTRHTNGHFYRFLSIPNARVWDALPQAISLSLGGRQGFLATPTSAAEMAVIRSVAGTSSAWIGITDDFQENTFRLIGEDAWGPISTGATATQGRYVNWLGGQPDNAGSMEDYVHIIATSATTWNDQRATDTMNGAVVEFEPKSSRRIHNVTFTATASRTATVSTASNLGLGNSHIGAGTFTADETVVATVTAPSGSTLSATGAATISGSGTGTLTIEGSKANVNSTLANVTVTAGSAGDKTITVSYRAKQANNGTGSVFKYNATTDTYYRSYTTSANYTTARSTAESLRFGGVPGYLTTIGSAAERNFIKTNVTSGSHLAGTDDLVNEGQWTTSGRDEYRTIGFDNVVLPGGFVQWNTGEPNGGTNQNCVVNFWAGDLADDGTCTSSYNYVVEFRPYTVTQSLTMEVNGSPSVATPNIGLTATVGQAYSLTLAATGGVGPYTYSLTSGTLPSGLSLSTGGVVSGTATEAPQTRVVTVQVADANGATSTTSFTMLTDATTCVTATTVVGGHTVHQFTDTGYCQWTVPAGVTSIDGFVVGGGGGGGGDGGAGGGGGGYHPVNGIAVTPGDTLTIRVGAGGAGGLWGGNGTAGGASSIAAGSTMLAMAAGGSVGLSGPGNTGGAGGTVTNGFNGGAGGSSSASYPSVGTGGKRGASNYFLGSLNTYGGGGGGGSYAMGQDYAAPAGVDGGGNGCDAGSPANAPGSDGSANTGGGGGGGCAGWITVGGAGGSGVVMIRHTTDPLDAFPAAISGLTARFVADDYQTLDTARKRWIDTTNNGKSVTTVGGTPSITEVTGNGSSKTVRTVNGGINESLTFPSFDITSSTYTMFHLARYSGSTKARIFTSPSGNWLSGFWGGVSGVAYHNAWMTSTSPSNASTSHWVLSSDQNILYRANGRNVTTVTSGMSYSSPLGINTGWSLNPGGERSQWQVPELIVYDRVLTADEIRQVESYLARTYGLLGSDVNNASQGVLSPRTVSAARVGTTSTGASDRLTVTWTAPTDTDGVTDYKVEYKEQGTNIWSEWAHTASASLTSAEVTGLSGGTAYDFRVTAVDSGATNRPSVATSATTWGGPTLALTSTPANPKTATTYTLVVTLTGADGTTGTVAFSEGGAVIEGCDTRPVVSGLASCQWTPTTRGVTSLTAAFTGDSTNLATTTVSATSLTVERGVCTTATGTTGRFTYLEVTSTIDCVMPALPAGVETVDALVVGGGGGGAENVGSGGGGGGGYFVANAVIDPTDYIEVTVGAGGRGGSYSTDTTTATSLRDGSNGSSSVVSWGSNTFTGGGGAGGQTYWANDVCGGSGGRNGSVIAGGTGSGTGGTAHTGGVGGQGSTGSGVAGSAGGIGFLNNITGTDVRYGGAGGGGGWSAAGGAGGQGGGGAGSGVSGGAGVSGTSGTGGGGGGGSANCGAGGRGADGRVIVRYANVPTISTQPVAASKTRGQSHTFTVSASAVGATSGQIVYQWLKDGVAIAGATSDTYTIASLSTTDAGSYSVVVKSSADGTAVSSRASTAVTLLVGQDSQSITFGALSARTYGDADFTVTATASSGLLVSFASDDTNICTVGTGSVSGGVTTVTINIGVVGSCTITASQAGDTEFTAATSVSRSLVVNPKTLTIAGLVAADKVYDRTTAASVNFNGYSFGSSVVGSDVVTLDTNGAGASFGDANVAAGKTVTVTGLALAGADAGNYTLPSPITTTASITAKSVTLSGLVAADRTYDGGVVATISGTPGLSGVILGDTVTVSGTAAGAFGNKNVGAGKTVTVSGLSLAGTDAGNYSLTTYTTTASITARSVAATGLGAADRVYDGDVSAALVLNSPGLSGVVVGDVVSLDGANSATGAFANKNVGVGKTVTVSGLSLSGADAGNYSLSVYTTTASVTAKSVSLTGLSAADRVYDGGVVAVVSGTPGLSGVVSGDVVSVSGTAVGAFDTKTVASGKTVTVSGLSLSGTDAGNYSLSTYTTTASVTAKSVSLSGLTAADRTYDGGTVATISGTPSLVGVVSGDVVSVSGTATGAFANKNVGVGKTVTVSGLSLSGTDAGNYSLSTYTTTASVTAKSVSLSGLSAADRTYDGGTVATISGTPSLVGVVSGDVVLVSGTAAGAFDTKNVGAAKTVTVSGLSLSGADAGNYSLSVYTTTASITEKTLTVAGITASDKNYDKTTNAVVQHGLAQFVGVASGDVVTMVTTNISGTFDSDQVGSNRTVQISGVAKTGTDAANYVIVQPTTTASITTKTITVSGVIAADKVYDGSTETTASFFGATISGIESGDTVILDTANVSADFMTETVGAAKTVTIANLALSGADSSNYRLIQPTTTASVTAKSVSLTGLSAADRVYDGGTVATISGTPSLVGVVSGDVVSVSGTAAGAFDTKNVGAGKTVTVSGVSLAGTDAGNYSLSTYTTTASVTSKSVSLSGLTAADRTYDGGTVATISGTPSLVGVVSGDVVSVSGTAAGAFANKNVGAGKTVTVSGLSLAGTDAGNYSLSVYTTTASVTAKSVSLSGLTAADRVYDGGVVATISGTPGLSGVILGDTVTVSGTAAGAFANKNVGAGKTVTVSGLSLSGADAGNYSLAVFTTKASITAKSVLLTGLSAADRTYDGGVVAVVSGTPGLSGVVSGDVVSVSGTAVGAFDTKTVASGKTVTVSGVSLAGTDAGNYSLSTYTTTASITAKSLTVTGVTTATREYDATTGVTASFVTASFVGLVNGDVVTLNTQSAIASFLTKEVGVNKPVTIIGVSIGGADAVNYAFQQPTSVGSITAKPLQVVGMSSPARVYDGTRDAPLNVGAASFSGVMSNDVVTLNAVNAVGTHADKNVGANKTVTVTGVVAGGSDGGNYVVPDFTVPSSITRRQATVVGATAGSRVYDGTRSATSVLSFSGATLSNVVQGDGVAFDTSGATGQFDSRHVGPNKSITVTGLAISGTDAVNYELVAPTVTGAITPATAQVGGLSMVNHVYDGTTDAAALVDMSNSHLVGALHVDDVVTIDGSAMLANFASPEVGTNKVVNVSGIVLAGAQAANYSLVQPTLTADIQPREVSVSGVNVGSKVYDGTTSATSVVSAAGATLTNVVMGDDVRLQTGSITANFAQRSVGTNKPVSISGFTISGGDATNYRLRQPTAAGTITPLTLTVTGVTAEDKIYDGNTNAAVSFAGVNLVGLVGNDAVTLDTSAATGAFNNAEVGNNKPVTVNGLVLAGLDASNYVLATPTVTASINTGTTAWMTYRAETSVAAAETQPRVGTPQVLPPAPAKVSTRSVSRGRATRVTAVRAAKDAAIPVTHAIISVRSTSGRLLARINVQVDPNNPRTAVTVPYVSRRVRVTVQFANQVGISKGSVRGINVAEGNTYAWSTVGGAPQVRGTVVPGTLVFARGSSKLTTTVKKRLRTTARRVRARGGLVYVTGYAQEGELRSSWMLDSLARKRAKAVADYLSQLGVRQWIKYQGQAESRNPWNTSRERRVVVSTEPYLE